MDGLYLTCNYYFYCKQQLLLLLFLQSFHIYILHTLTVLECTLSCCKRESMEVGRNVGHWCINIFFVNAGSKLADASVFRVKFRDDHHQNHGYFMMMYCVKEHISHSEKSICCRCPSSM